VQSKQACKTTVVPAMLQQSVVTGEIGPDAINVGESSCLGSGLTTERSGDTRRPTGWRNGMLCRLLLL